MNGTLPMPLLALGTEIVKGDDKEIILTTVFYVFWFGDARKIPFGGFK